MMRLKKKKSAFVEEQTTNKQSDNVLTDDS